MPYNRRGFHSRATNSGGSKIGNFHVYVQERLKQQFRLVQPELKCEPNSPNLTMMIKDAEDRLKNREIIIASVTGRPVEAGNLVSRGSTETSTSRTSTVGTFINGGGGSTFRGNDNAGVGLR